MSESKETTTVQIDGLTVENGDEPYLFPLNELEPKFTIRGRDPAGAATIDFWCKCREELIAIGIIADTVEERLQIASARKAADQIRKFWPKSFGNWPTSNS